MKLDTTRVGITIPAVYEDRAILVVDKPRNIHVHSTRLSRGEHSVQSVLEQRLNKRLYPVHRLDRPVSGILLMAKNAESASKLGIAFRTRGCIDKRYLCVIRGWLSGSGSFDRPLRQAPNKPLREAKTSYRVLATVEAPWSDGIFPTSRYTLLECKAETGRFHQIRRHLAGGGHPVIGDVAHGDNPRNRIWLRETGIDCLLLRSHSLCFTHPGSGKQISLCAPPYPQFMEAAKLFGWPLDLAAAPSISVP